MKNCLRDCLNFFQNKVEPTSGFRIVRISAPPVSPEVIHIQVLLTFVHGKPCKGLI